MSLSQQLTEFRFNLETLDLLTTMGKSTDYSIQMLSELGLKKELINFMQTKRMLLNSILLRLQLYGEQNMNEQNIRNNLLVLNNQSVFLLLDYFYKSSSKEEVVEKIQTSVDKEVEYEVEAEAEEEDYNYFDKFFESRMHYHPDDASQTVKMSAIYDVFTKWWNNYSEDEVPSKDELKEYLVEKLGHSIKSIVSNVSLA